MEESKSAVNYYFDLQSVDNALAAINKEANPLEWARLMNNRGIILIGLDKFSEAEAAFIAAFPVADSPLKCKILLNSAKNNFFANNSENALKQLNKIAPLAKECPRRQAPLFIGHAQLIKGEILYRGKNEKLALTEFMKAEYSFEGEADLSGVGISCMEIARVHVNNKNLSMAWPFLKKSENCLAKFGPEESLGVVVCKAVALYYDGKELEAEALLKQAYVGIDEFGFARYMVSEMLDAYLYIRLKSVKFQKNFM
jgi:hypothetical protein